MPDSSPTMDLLNKNKGTGAATATTTKKKAKPKAVDLIQETAFEIENLKTEEDARKLALQLRDSTAFTNFRLGGVLSKIQTEMWFGDHSNFKLYAEMELGIGYRKAAYLTQTYNGLLATGVPWEKVKDLGWTKLRELISVLNADNVDEWLERVEGLTTLQIIDLVKKSKSDTAAKDPDDLASSDVTTMTFKIHEDQKETIRKALDKARDDFPTDVDAVALEHICLSFMNVTIKAPKLQETFSTFKDAYPEDVTQAITPIFAAFEEIFPTVNISVEIAD